MSSPAPLLRPPVPGARGSGGSRTPRLGLSIPPSPNVRPVVNGTSEQPQLQQPPPPPPPQQLPQLPQQPSLRPGPPALRINTPVGGNAAPQRPRMALQLNTGVSASSSSASGRPQDSRQGSTSAVPQYPGLSFPLQQQSLGDNLSTNGDGGVPMKRDNSVGALPDLEKLSLEKGRSLDVEDLDDAGWRAASSKQMITELGSLGEGAGGAVTRCILKGGKTVFALKVIRTRGQN